MNEPKDYGLDKLAAKGARKICGSCTLAPYDCPRKKPPIAKVKVPRVGTEDVCPLDKYKVEVKDDPRPWYERPASETEVTEKELFALCANCGHAKFIATGAELRYERADLRAFCCDCPVMSAADAIAECEAEAAANLN